EVDVNRSAIVLGDPDRLQQVVWNLLSNAIKFTPAGGLVRTGVLQTGDDVELVVQDTGEGIDPKFLPSVFERFRQADGARPREGLGLGLAIVKELIELHGGTIAAESAGKGQGTRIFARLPALDTAATLSQTDEPGKALLATGLASTQKTY